MYELIQISENDYYIDCPSKVGIVNIGNGEAVVIDTGNDRDMGKKINKILESHAWKLKCIFNTHSHADHTGGNAFLQEKTSCDIYANAKETAYINTPFLQCASLFGGYPFKEIQNKFLLSEESFAKSICEDVLPVGMKILHLPGHSIDMIGFLTKDKNAYIGDCVSSKETIEKYGITFLFDLEKTLQTLEKIKEIEANIFIPAHAEPTKDIVSLADYNICSIKNNAELIYDLTKGGICFDEIMKKLFDRLGLCLTAQQYLIVGSTVKCYLSYLFGLGMVFQVCENNKMIWKAK